MKQAVAGESELTLTGELSQAVTVKVILMDSNLRPLGPVQAVAVE